MLSYFEISSAAAILRNSLGLGTNLFNFLSGLAAVAHMQQQSQP